MINHDHTAADTQGPMYSVVIPVYRSANILPRTLERLDAFFDKHPMRHEIIFINDGSPDNSWPVLEKIKGDRDDVVIIDLLRNSGQHSAMMCGLEHACGDFVITMDDDLQNPPEQIIHLIEKINEGHDVVFGEFPQKMHGLTRMLGSKVIGWLNTKLFKKPPGLVLTNFRIIRRDIVDAVCEFNTSFPYLPGLLLMSGKTFANIRTEHHARAEGKSNYSTRVIAALIWRILFNYSAFPLRVLCGVGVVMAVASFVLGAFYLIRALNKDSAAPGWPTLVVLLSFYQGLTLILLGALGEYVVRVVNDVSGRKAYRVRKKL